MTPADKITSRYRHYTRKKVLIGVGLFVLLIILALYSVSTGAMDLGLGEVFEGLARSGTEKQNVVVWNIRIPRITTAVFVGLSLAVAGCAMQCLLRNPLASPYTMGISQGAAFGAAFAIIVLGMGQTKRAQVPIFIDNPYMVTICAFAGALVGIVMILSLARLRGLSPSAMILAGIAMGSLFSAATMLLQYFAEDVKVASVVFWTFGDVGRAAKQDVFIMAGAGICALGYFIYMQKDYNVLEGGEETARALGINTTRVRIVGVFVAALLTAVCVSLVGIIGFVGLVAPHIMRRLVGGDYRFLIPLSAIFGAILLLAADTAARTILSPVVLPVGILTSFIGVPLFIYLIAKKGGHYW